MKAEKYTPEYYEQDSMRARGVVFHHVVLNDDLVFEGLHDTKLGAVLARRSLIDKVGATRFGKTILGDLEGEARDKREKELQEQKKADWTQTTRVSELQAGQEYGEWGKGRYTHGVNDGAHGSERIQHIGIKKTNTFG